MSQWHKSACMLSYVSILRLIVPISYTWRCMHECISILLPSYIHNMHQDTKLARLIAVCKRNYTTPILACGIKKLQRKSATPHKLTDVTRRWTIYVAIVIFQNIHFLSLWLVSPCNRRLADDSCPRQRISAASFEINILPNEISRQNKRFNLLQFLASCHILHFY